MSQEGSSSFVVVDMRADDAYQTARKIFDKLSKRSTKSLTNDDFSVLAAATEDLNTSYLWVVKMMKEKENDIKKLCNQLETAKKELEKEHTQSESYAAAAKAAVAKADAAAAAAAAAAASTNVLKPPAQRRDPHAVVRIIPKADPNTGLYSAASSEATKKCLSTKLMGSGVGVTALWNTSNKGVAISCRSRDEAEKVTAIVNQQMAGAFEAAKQTLRNPVVTILLTDDRCAEKEKYSEIAVDILKKNDFLENTAENPLKVVHGYNTKHGNTIVVIEMGAKNFQDLKQRGNRIYALMDCCKAKERTPITQCFKCQRFGHKSVNCRYVVSGKPASRCVRCGENHGEENKGKEKCLKAPKCVNCTEHNIYMKLSAPVDHEASDHKCPARLRAEKRAKSQINYAY